MALKFKAMESRIQFAKNYLNVEIVEGKDDTFQIHDCDTGESSDFCNLEKIDEMINALWRSMELSKKYSDDELITIRKRYEK